MSKINTSDLIDHVIIFDPFSILYVLNLFNILGFRVLLSPSLSSVKAFYY